MRDRILFSLLFGLLAMALQAADRSSPYLLLPEPRAMRSSTSRELGTAQRTVFTPARLTADGAVKTYPSAEFAKLGIGVDSFIERAQKAADARLATLQPELKKDDHGHVAYAVYRSDEPSIASLIVAPALSQIFKKIFGEEIWLVAPDRHSLFVFPAKAEVVSEYADDLRERFEGTAYGASEEIFSRKSGESSFRVVGSFIRR